MLFYPRRTFLSALMLALAVHLKGSPAVLVLAFLLEKDWRWLAWFAVSLVAIAGITVLTDGFTPFLDVLQHWQGLALSNNTIYHDTSFDSFLRSTAQFVPLEPAWTRVLIYAGKAALAAASLWVMVRCVRTAQFVQAAAAGRADAERHPAAVHPDDADRAGGVGTSRRVRGASVPGDAEAPGDARTSGCGSALPTCWSSCCRPSTSTRGRSGGWLAPMMILWQMWRLAGAQGRCRDVHSSSIAGSRTCPRCGGILASSARFAFGASRFASERLTAAA